MTFSKQKAFSPRLILTVLMLSGLECAEGASKSSPPLSDDSRTVVNVTLVSDGKTLVSIPDVLAPRVLSEVKLTLPPGTYDVVGRRIGYRDIKKKLVVRTGMPHYTLAVACDQSEK